uniref:AB hydrolase-1 domain-containing protein n=1 Tax=Leersia perrieri TaxID=77586 RepID=A0A0D9VQ74_9ORYZ
MQADARYAPAAKISGSAQLSAGKITITNSPITMGASLSLVPLLDYVARREFAAAGLRPGEVTLPYPVAGGESTCTVHYWASAGEPRLPPLLLIHGFGPRATWQWRCQVGPLSRHFHLIVPDLLGFGDSSYGGGGGESPPPPPSEATQAAAMAALLDALPGTNGRRVAVAGTSYGGFVAYWLARTAGAERVGPVVVASSDLLKTAEDDKGFLKRAGDGWRGVDEVLLPKEPAAMRKLLEMASYRPPPAVLMPDFLLRDFIQKLFTENREQHIQLFKGITVGTDKFPVTPISQEVLIVWGEQDQLFPVEKAYAVQRSLDGKARVEIISKTGHAPQLEDPTRFNKILMDFLLDTHNFGVLPLMEYIARRAFLAAGLRPSTVTLPSGDGDGEARTTTIHYWAPPGEPRLPPLLLIHGFGPMSTWQWRAQVGPFSRRFHVIVPDLLCFGSSSCPSSPPPSESAQAAALLTALPAILAGTTAAKARVAVVGTSYGGFVAYAMARAAAGGERVGPVVIASSDLMKTAEDDQALLERAGAGGGWARPADLLMPLDARGARRLMEMTFYRKQVAAMLPDFVIRDTMQKLFSDRREEKIELMNATTVGTDAFQLTPLAQDVLLIWGDHDQIFPLDKAFAVKSCLGENVRLEIIKKTGHVPQMEEPDQFNKIVMDFLVASPGSPSA